jgi:2,4-dienoyl-CoA reductase-like NADH-dependent reductase (Old Yellow Enzyme family)
MGLNSVCKSLTINNVTIPNRIIFPAFQTNFATSQGLEYADRILSDKKANLVAICRPQVADPFFVNRSGVVEI